MPKGWNSTVCTVPGTSRLLTSALLKGGRMKATASTITIASDPTSPKFQPVSEARGTRRIRQWSLRATKLRRSRMVAASASQSAVRKYMSGLVSLSTSTARIDPLGRRAARPCRRRKVHQAVHSPVATVQARITTSTSRSQPSRWRKARSGVSWRRRRISRLPSSARSRTTPKASRAPAAAIARTSRVPLEIDHPPLRRGLEVVRRTHHPPAQRLVPAADLGQARLRAAEPARVEVDHQVAMAANAQIEKGLDPGGVARGGYDDGAAPGAPVLALRLEQAGQGVGPVRLGQGELLQQALTLLITARGLDQVQRPVVGDESHGGAPAQSAVGDRGGQADRVLQRRVGSLTGVDAGLEVEHDPGIAALPGLEAPAHETPQPGRGGPVDPLEAVGGNVLADGGGVGREIDQAPPGLLVSGHAGRQRLE